MTACTCWFSSFNIKIIIIYSPKVVLICINFSHSICLASQWNHNRSNYLHRWVKFPKTVLTYWQHVKPAFPVLTECSLCLPSSCNFCLAEMIFNEVHMFLKTLHVIWSDPEPRPELVRKGTFFSITISFPSVPLPLIPCENITL